MMESNLEKLKALLAESNDLQAAAALLAWDQRTYMPPGGAEGRSYQLATVESLAHAKFTSPEIGRLLEDLQPYAASLDPDSNEARLIKVTGREYMKQIRVPTEMVAEFARVTALAQEVWQQARATNDFAYFRPHLEKVVELRRRYADLFQPYEHVYDPLLDDFEPGLKTRDVQEIFAAVRPQQVALIHELAQRPQVDSTILRQSYDPQKQWDFGVEVITRFGYDWSRGRQDKSVHPFTQSTGIDDVRITTRVYPDYLNAAIFGTMHEAGHALYGQGIERSLARSPLAEGASLAVHESQSRMWENFVGRSLPFWEFFYPRLRKMFPEQLGKVNLEAFYKAINRVEPSPIRVEADEATYNLHIMLRLELEIALMEGSLEVKDLPDAWNARMQEYLGVTPPDDTQGVMQDIHWSTGAIGYFSTYAIGNLIAAQLWERINAEFPDLAEQIRQGQFAGLLAWLRRNIHQHGAKFEPQELVQRVTGSKIDPAPYIKYLRSKYSQIYKL